MPTIAAFSYRHSRGLPYVYPDNELGFTENFLSMMFRMAEPRYSAEPALSKALEVLFILHADHEQNCSANVDALDRLVARPIRTRRSPARPRRSTGRCTAARTRRCCGCSPRSAT